MFETKEADTPFKLFVDLARSYSFLAKLEGNISHWYADLKYTCSHLGYTMFVKFSTFQHGVQYIV